MFRKNTTFVIGAGASQEFGMPTGWQLAKKIKKRTVCVFGSKGEILRPVDDTLYDLVRNENDVRKQSKLLNAIRAINQGIETAVSIDAFIDRLQANEEVSTIGKLLIALEIAEAERQSMLSPQHFEIERNGADAKRAEDTWIGSFVRILLDGEKEPNNIGKDISIVCFNYDRCIEFYLVSAISKAYDIAEEEAAEIVEGMNIIHPYGTLGSLPRKGMIEGSDILTFGPTLNLLSHDWLAITEENIRTYTAQIHKPDETKKIHDAIGNCNVLVFLGFGFNMQNLNLLRVSNYSKEYDMNPRQVYSSGKGISKKVESTLHRRIGKLFDYWLVNRNEWERRINIEFGSTCSETFDIHNFNLSRFDEKYVDHTLGTESRGSDSEE